MLYCRPMGDLTLIAYPIFNNQVEIKFVDTKTDENYLSLTEPQYMWLAVHIINAKGGSLSGDSYHLRLSGDYVLEVECDGIKVTLQFTANQVRAIGESVRPIQNAITSYQAVNKP